MIEFMSGALTLGQLRDQWARLTRTDYGPRTVPDATPIDVASLEGFADRFAARRAAALDQVDRIIAGTAVDLANRRIAEAGDGANLTDLHNAAGERAAAAADRIAKNGGRGTVWDATKSDPRALGYARISLNPPPCYWCAILISQGRAYSSHKAAQFDADGNLYHDHCACVAVPLFTTGQFGGSEFDLSRRYRQVWDGLMSEHNDSYEARRAFRRLLEAEQRESGKTKTTAVLATAA
jgi:hypothetical protein